MNNMFFYVIKMDGIYLFIYYVVLLCSPMSLIIMYITYNIIMMVMNFLKRIFSGIIGKYFIKCKEKKIMMMCLSDICEGMNMLEKMCKDNNYKKVRVAMYNIVVRHGYQYEENIAKRFINDNDVDVFRNKLLYAKKYNCIYKCCICYEKDYSLLLNCGHEVCCNCYAMLDKCYYENCCK